MIFEDLNWLIYGVLIGLFVPALLIIGNKQFGVSSGLQNLCTTILPKTKSVFSDYNFKSNSWKLYFIIGIILGSFFAVFLLGDGNSNFLPDNFYSVKGVIILFVGGFFVGFGSRYAKGCTSGHSITGLSMLQFGSLAATISFFIGGLIYTWLV